MGLKIFLFFLLAFGFASIFFISYFREFLKEKKKLYIVVTLVTSSVLFISGPVNLLWRLFDQSSVLIYEAKLKEVLTSEASSFYEDIFYDQDGKNLYIISYDGIRQKKDWLVFDLGTKAVVSKKDLSKAVLHNFENSPYEKISIEQGEYSGSISKSVKTTLRDHSKKRQWDIFQSNLLSGNEWTWSPNGFYFTKEENSFLSIHTISFRDGKEQKVSPPQKAMYFNPFYWKKEETLLYIEVESDEGFFITNLILKKADDEAIKKFLFKSVDFDLHPYKMSTNSEKLLAIVDGKTNVIKFIDMRNYPFEISSKEDLTFSRYKYGYDVALKNINKILSLSFHPREASDFALLAVPEGRAIPQLYHYTLIPSKIDKYPIGFSAYASSGFSFLIFLLYGFLYYYMRRVLFH